MMLPMRVTHKVVGMDLGFIPKARLRLGSVPNEYRDIPASTEYPAVTMHTMVDLIGQQLVWPPMTSRGTGEASGIELFRYHPNGFSPPDAGVGCLPAAKFCWDRWHSAAFAAGTSSATAGT
jgi:hypothetical protein